MFYNCTNCIRVYHVSESEFNFYTTGCNWTSFNSMSFLGTLRPDALTLTFTGNMEQWHNKIVAARDCFSDLMSHENS